MAVPEFLKSWFCEPRYSAPVPDCAEDRAADGDQTLGGGRAEAYENFLNLVREGEKFILPQALATTLQHFREAMQKSSQNPAGLFGD